MAVYTAESEDVRRIPAEREKGFGHNLRKYLREYNETTGIHGLRYVTEKRSRCEKLFWGIVLLISLAGCIFMIYEVLYKYNNSPVVVSFASEDTPLFQIPFPAVTICPEPKFSRSKFNYTDVHLRIERNEVVAPEEMRNYQHLSLLCYENNKKVVKNNQTFREDFYDTVEELRLDKELIFGFCYFDEEVPCDDILTPVFIDDGICYSFNILGRQEIFKDHVVHYKNYYHVPNTSTNFFDIELGYSKSAGINPYPRRALKSGADEPFVITLRYQNNDTDPACNTFFDGFTVLIHNAWDVPRLSKHYFRVPPGKTVVAAIEPEMIETSQTVRRFHPDKRKCYMKDERPLKHFRFYTQSNCLLECLTNFTLGKCGCVDYSMPRDSKTSICGNQECMEEAETELKQKDLESRLSEQSFCDCKPACTDIKYSAETSHSNFHYKEYLKLQHQELDPGESFSVLQVYFKNEQFLTMERNELYGVSDLISNLGGLVGLFTGFSLISGVEIIYFCSLRIFYNERLYGLWSGPPN